MRLGLGLALTRRMGGGSNAGYLAFLAQMAAKTSNVYAAGDGVIRSTGTQAARTTLASTGSMLGTSFGSIDGFTTEGSSSHGAVARHLFPDQATWQASLTAGDQVYLFVNFNSDRSATTGLDRNGLSTAGYAGGAGPQPTSVVLEFAYYDRVLARARRILTPATTGVYSDFPGTFVN